MGALTALLVVGCCGCCGSTSSQLRWSCARRLNLCEGVCEGVCVCACKNACSGSVDACGAWHAAPWLCAHQLARKTALPLRTHGCRECVPSHHQSMRAKHAFLPSDKPTTSREMQCPLPSTSALGQTHQAGGEERSRCAKARDRPGRAVTRVWDAEQQLLSMEASCRID